MKNLYILSSIVILSVNPKAEAMFARMAGLYTSRSSVCNRMYRAFSSEPANFIDADGTVIEQTEIAVPAQLEQSPFAVPKVTEISLPQATAIHGFVAKELANTYRSFASNYFNNPLEKSILETPVDDAVPVIARLHARNILAKKMATYVEKNAWESKTRDHILWITEGPVSKISAGKNRMFPLEYKNLFEPLYHGNATDKKGYLSVQESFFEKDGKHFLVNRSDLEYAIVPRNIQHVRDFIYNREIGKLKELEKQYATLLSQAHGQEEKDFLAQELAKGIEQFDKYVVAETAKYLDAVPQEIARLIE